jgi:hypothetical protein
MSVRRFTPSGTVLVAALALAIGLEAPAAAHQVAHKISGSSIKEHTVAGDRLKDNTLTGKQIKESTLGQVPRAKTAVTAARLPALVWHDITPAQFDNGWHNLAQDGRAAAWAVDAQGIVHLRGSVEGGTLGAVAIKLPARIAPYTGVLLQLQSTTAADEGTAEVVNIGSEALWFEGEGSTTLADTYDSSLEGLTFSVPTRPTPPPK